MHCVNRNLQLVFFKSLFIQNNQCLGIIHQLPNYHWSRDFFPLLVTRSTKLSVNMTEKSHHFHKDINVESKEDENIQAFDDGFFVIDSLPSPILIDIDQPSKYRKIKCKVMGYKTDHIRHRSRLPKAEDAVPSTSKSINAHEKESKHKNSKTDPPKHCSKKDSQSLYTDNGSPSACKIKDKTRGLYSKKRKPKSVDKVVESEEEDIIYEGTFHRNYLPFEPGFFREHLLKSTTHTYSQKRHHSLSGKHHHKNEVVQKSKTYPYENKGRGMSSSGNQNENNIQTKSNRINYKDLNLETFGDKYVDRVTLSSDSDSDVIIEDDIDTGKENTGRPTTSETASSCYTNEDASKFLHSCTSHEIVLEEGELLDSDDSLLCKTFPENGDVYDNISMELDVNDDDSSESEIAIAVDSSDFVPLTNIKLSDIDYDVPISSDVKEKRQNLESLRRWELTGLGQEVLTFSKKINGTLFTLLSYNVLAQQLIQDNISLYDGCDPKNLEWSYRWPLLQHEIRHLQPDILTLQEVQSSHYHTHYLPWLNYFGYKCIFKKRTGTKGDGCAIAFNSTKFNMIEENSVEYYQPTAGPVLDRDNVGIIVKLTPTAFFSPFCVATTHLLFNPRRSDIKLAQIVLFLTELDRICYETVDGGRTLYCPLILTGDFNTEPYSCIMELIRRGTLKYAGLSKRTLSWHDGFGPVFESDLIPPTLGVSDYCQHIALDQSRYLDKIRGNLFALNDKRKIEEKLIKISHTDRTDNIATDNIATDNIATDSSQNLMQTGCVSSGMFQHSFNFKSVYYHKLRRCNGATEVTTYQHKWVTVDYIFYTKVLSNLKSVEGLLKLIGRYGLLSAEEARKVGPLPSDICPSDHFPLAAQFLLKPKPS